MKYIKGISNYNNKLEDIEDVFKDFGFDFDCKVQFIHGKIHNAGDILIDIGLDGINKLLGVKDCLNRLKDSLVIISVSVKEHPIGEYPQVNTYDVSYFDGYRIKNINSRISRIDIKFEII